MILKVIWNEMKRIRLFVYTWITFQKITYFFIFHGPSLTHLSMSKTWSSLKISTSGKDFFHLNIHSLLFSVIEALHFSWTQLPRKNQYVSDYFAAIGMRIWICSHQWGVKKPNLCTFSILPYFCSLLYSLEHLCSVFGSKPH